MQDASCTVIPPWLPCHCWRSICCWLPAVVSFPAVVGVPTVAKAPAIAGYPAVAVALILLQYEKSNILDFWTTDCKIIGLVIFSAIGLPDYGLSDRSLRNTIGLSIIGLTN